MARGGASTGGNSKSARSTRKYKRNGSGQFGSGSGSPHKGRGKGRGASAGAKAGHQSNGGPSAQRAGSAKNAGQRSQTSGGSVGNGTSTAERERRNLIRKRVGGAAIGGFASPLGSVIGAGIGNAIARKQNREGRAPQYKAYSSKKMARRNKRAAKKKR